VDSESMQPGTGYVHGALDVADGLKLRALWSRQPAYWQVPSSMVAATRWFSAVESAQPRMTGGHEPSSCVAAGSYRYVRESVQPPMPTQVPSSTTANAR
jgi:hypothetical protein